MVAIAFGLRSEGISHIPSSSVTSRNTEPAYDQVTINQLDMIGVPHQAGIVTLPSEDLRAALTPQVVTASWSQDAIDFKVPPGLTAIILEDEPLFQVTTAVAFEIKLIPVVGVYDRCELLAESRQWASIYALDNRMAGAMMAADCARVIHSINPAAIILLNSTTPPDEPTGRLGKSLREQIREVGFSDNQIGGGTKDAFSKQLIESLVKILQ
ncbi:MAG: hypothetical protein GW762_03175 [Candidatus Pacebacteria bacterium]|nr:hypothetical protein [Candidatus Paceibacterota bacterium]